MEARGVYLKEPAELAYREFASLAAVEPPAPEAVKDLNALDHLLKQLPSDPTPENFMLAGNLERLRRATIRDMAVCYAVYPQTIEIISIVRISEGPSGYQIWKTLLASGQHERALRAIGLQQYRNVFIPQKASAAVQ